MYNNNTDNTNSNSQKLKKTNSFQVRININQDPSATFATCTINRDMAKEEGRIMSLFKNRDSIAEIYAVDGHAIYMKYYPDGSLRSQLDQDNVYEDRYFMCR